MSLPGLGETGRYPSPSVKPVLFHRPDLPVQRYANVFELHPAQQPPRRPGYRLWFDESGMSLCDERGSPGVVLSYRDIEARSRQSLLLARACAASRRPAVADLMAGWGIDGLSLALRGCTVTLVERSPLVWALLDDFATRLDLPASVVFGSAEQWCRTYRKSVDVAYLDPMFPERRKTALPEKRMQVLRDLAWQGGPDLLELIDRARLAARDRVVVKRRARDPVCAAPGWQLRGRRIRFDVYRAG